MILKGGMVAQNIAYFGPIRVRLFPNNPLSFLSSLKRKSKHGPLKTPWGYREERKSKHGPLKTPWGYREERKSEHGPLKTPWGYREERKSEHGPLKTHSNLGL